MIMKNFEIEMVKINQNFLVSKYLTTQKQWCQIMGLNPPTPEKENKPIESISYNDIQIFLLRLYKLTHEEYSLPTKKQWDIFSGKKPENLDEFCWYKGNTNTTQNVGLKKPNEFGLYDIYGNVLEILEDTCTSEQFRTKDPKTGFYKINRMIIGGAYTMSPINLFNDDIYIESTYSYGNNIGFRLVKNLGVLE